MTEAIYVLVEVMGGLGFGYAVHEHLPVGAGIALGLACVGLLGQINERLRRR